MGEGITSVAFRRDRLVPRVRPLLWRGDELPDPGDVSAQAGGSRRGGRQGARRGLWDGGARAPNCRSPRGLANPLERCLAEGADSHDPRGASGAPPAGPRRSLRAESAQSVSASPSLSLPSSRQRPGFRPCVRPRRLRSPSLPFASPGHASSSLRNAPGAVGEAGGLLSTFSFFPRRLLDLGRWKRALRAAAAHRPRPWRPCVVGVGPVGAGVAASRRNPLLAPLGPSSRARALSSPEIPGR